MQASGKDGQQKLVWYIEEANILNINKSGFRQSRGTTDNLAILQSDIMENFSYRRDVVAVFLDIKKAYDCVWRSLVPQKLHESQICGNMHSSPIFQKNM